jgi:hypothetical protein
MLRVAARFALLALAAAALAGCGRGDAYSIMPESMRMPKPEVRQADPEPDAVQLFRGNLKSVFAESAKPRGVMVSKPRRDTLGLGWTVCIKASLTAVSGAPIGVQTFVVGIDQGKIGMRRMAEPKDGCQTEAYERV